ncbi:AMP-binding protein [Paraferrimonas sp. SM1919]|uniref:AMP-binding protein n=1 Tax=Paraferrimonas sp. SM1919 TaxID=2662263 RepID=UPI0013D5B576|nr:AMP-binding protein [Paraferrimonas sp. SM1919]
MSAKPILEMFEHWVATQPQQTYLRQPINGEYQDYTWSEVKQQALKLLAGLNQLGIHKGDKVAILSKNCAEWFITDIALMMGGIISVPIYPTANTKTISYVIEHSEAKAIFIGKLDHYQEQEAAIPGNILRMDFPYPTMPCQYSWQQMQAMAEAAESYPGLAADELMTLIYTSGSTGNPKGVMHTYGAHGHNSAMVAKDLAATTEDRVISYLPLAHITERTYIEGASFYYGGTIGFAEALDTFVNDVKRAAPTLFLSVPRLWTLFQQNVIAKIGHSKLELLLKLPIIKGVVAKKIRAELGLADARVLGCGSAPVPASLLQWYQRIGMNITEAWGMSENGAYATLNYPFNPAKIGTVGKPGLECEVKIGDNQELLFKSPGLMTGYYKQEAETADTFTADGFLKTGDCAELDEDGYVKIIGRVKDNFKSAKGKYISPVPIERKIMQNHLIEMTCVIGSGLPHPIALVQLSEAAQKQDREQVRASLAQTISEVNPTLESHETLDALVIVSENWEIENDILTPTLKIKRHVLEEKFNPIVDGLRKQQIKFQDEI